MSGTLILIGAGAHGRGTLEILKARRATGLDVPEAIGFVDDDPARHGTSVDGLPVFGPVQWLLDLPGQRPSVILALASSRAKHLLALRLEALEWVWAQAIHPSMQSASGVTFGAGAIVNAGVCLAFDTRIGKHTTLNLGATIGHDCSVGDYSTVAPGVNIAGRVTLGEGVEVQTNATIVPGVTLGAWSKVGPGSVVLRDVAEHDAVFGNPARRIPPTNPDTRRA